MRQKMFLIAGALLAFSAMVVSPAKAEKKEQPPGTVKYVASDDVMCNEPFVLVSHDVACLDYAVPQVLLNPSSYANVISLYPAGFSPEIRANVRGPTTVNNYFIPRIRDKDNT